MKKYVIIIDKMDTETYVTFKTCELTEYCQNLVLDGRKVQIEDLDSDIVYIAQVGYDKYGTRILYICTSLDDVFRA